MCYKPLTIHNNTKNFDSLADKVDIKVPCGHCPSCQQVNRFNWQVRIHFENEFTVKSGGFVVFATLTYQKSKRPFVSITDNHGLSVPLLDDEGNPVYCFRKKDVSKLCHTLNRQFLRDKFPFKMKYFFTSEFGGEYIYKDRHNQERKAEHAPHYHCLFFLAKNGDLIEDLRTYQLYFCNQLRKKWSFGFVGLTPPPGCNDPLAVPGVVTGQGALGYCAKYLHKDYNSDEYFDKVRQKYHFDDVLSNGEVLKDCKCCHGQSTHFGECALSMISESFLNDGFCVLPLYNVDAKEVKYTKVQLPLYLDRKLNYTQVSTSSSGDRSYILTEKGVENKVRQRIRLREELEKKYIDFIAHTDKFTPDVLEYINLHLGTRYLTANSLLNDFKLNLCGSSVKTLVDYILLFEGMPFLDTNGHYVSNTLAFSLLNSTDYLSDSDFEKLCRLRLVKDRSSGRVVPKDIPVFNQHFKFFDRCIRIFELFNEVIGNDKYLEAKSKAAEFKKNQISIAKRKYA